MKIKTVRDDEIYKGDNSFRRLIVSSRSGLLPLEEEIEIALDLKGDYEEIISVLRRSYLSVLRRSHLSFENPEALAKRLSLSQNLVARAQGRIVGTVSYYNLVWNGNEVTETSQYRKNKMYHIWGLAVLPEYRNHGIATCLVREAERYMRVKKAKGYVGTSFPEETAQWWVCMFGVRLKRLAPNRLAEFGTPFEKRFRQDGFFEHLKASMREVTSFILTRTYTRVKTNWLRISKKNKPR